MLCAAEAMLQHSRSTTNKLYPPMDKAGANCSGPASDSLVASTDTKGTCLQYTAPAVAIHC
jgi:hypothetical protein